MLKYVFLCALVLSAVELATAQTECLSALSSCGPALTQSLSGDNLCNAVSTYRDCVKKGCGDDTSGADTFIKGLTSIKCGSTMVCSSLMFLVLMAMAARLFTRA